MIDINAYKNDPTYGPLIDQWYKNSQYEKTDLSDLPYDILRLIPHNARKNKDDGQIESIMLTK